MRTVQKILFGAGIAAAAAAGTAAAALKVFRDRAKAENLIDESTGIYVNDKPVIGGVRQYIQIRGEERNNPVLLFVHGGPGNPVSAMNHTYQREWEKIFTVVNWDQRGCGLSDDCEGELELEMFVEDIREVAEYVDKILPGRPIVIFGQSWGTIIGSIAAFRYPEIFTAYIGTGQVVDSTLDFDTGYAHAIECAEKEGDTELLNGLRADVSMGESKFLSKHYAAAKAKYGFASTKYRNMGNLAKTMLVSTVTSPNMKLSEAVKTLPDCLGVSPQYMRFVKGDEFLGFRLEDFTTEYRIPYYNISGDNDWQTPYVLAKEYFDKVQAPFKKWYSLDNCGHMVQFDAPEQLTEYLRMIRFELFPDM